jgi:uncharacterized coiled-coil DUF342 family protein
MSQTEVLDKIHEDLESLKKGMTEIKEIIRLEPELREEVKERVKQARERIARGEAVSNDDILREFGE